MHPMMYVHFFPFQDTWEAVDVDVVKMEPSLFCAKPKDINQMMLTRWEKGNRVFLA